ncbi:MAG TPA: cupin domain-containing protein [Candidatus Binatia bacterium]|nr:cupin domain-containing protein [Candidatus Binatia bacterium]
MKIINLQTALKRLPRLNDEVRYKNCFQEKSFTSGLIAFQPRKNSDLKQINHSDQDVVCQVLKGRGRLRIGGRRIRLRPGMICHIPKGTSHDFAAGKTGKLVLFYSLIKTG